MTQLHPSNTTMSSGRLGRTSRHANTITMTSTTLIVEPLVLPSAFRIRQHLVIPLAHVLDTSYDPHAPTYPEDLHTPQPIGIRWTGIFMNGGARSFWNVDGPGRTVVIELDSEYFTRLVLTADDPTVTIDTLKTALRHR